MQPLEDAHLSYLCYAILSASVAFAVANLPVTFGLASSTSSLAEADGVWQVMLVVFLVYGMLPLKTVVSFCTGVALPAVHLVASGAFTENHLGWKWQQVRLDRSFKKIE